MKKTQHESRPSPVDADSAVPKAQVKVVKIKSPPVVSAADHARLGTAARDPVLTGGRAFPIIKD
jgi:hypothetical protein